MIGRLINRVGSALREQLVGAMGTEDEQRAEIYAAIALDAAERWPGQTEDFRRPWNQSPWLER